MKIPLIAVIGDSTTDKGAECDIFAEKLGRLIIDNNWRVMTGGLGGIMESASRGARTSSKWNSGSIIGILPGNDPDAANPYIDIPIATGLDHGRNLLISQADAVVAVGGGAGTLSEIAMAWMYFRLIVAFRGPGWAGQLADKKVDQRNRYPDIPQDQVYGVDTPEEAVSMINRYLPMYTHRHNGISRRDAAKRESFGRKSIGDYLADFSDKDRPKIEKWMALWPEVPVAGDGRGELMFKKSGTTVFRVGPYYKIPHVTVKPVVGSSILEALKLRFNGEYHQKEGISIPLSNIELSEVQYFISSLKIIALNN